MDGERSAVAASYAASAVTTLAGLTINEWVAIGGFLIGAATFITNFHFKREQLKMQRRKDDDG